VLTRLGLPELGASSEWAASSSFYASATTATFFPRRAAMVSAHRRSSAVRGLCTRIIDCAACTSNQRTRLSPTLVIRPLCCFSPEPISLGTRPRNASTWWAPLNRLGSSSAATRSCRSDRPDTRHAAQSSHPLVVPSQPLSHSIELRDLPVQGEHRRQQRCHFGSQSSGQRELADPDIESLGSTRPPEAFAAKQGSRQADELGPRAHQGFSYRQSRTHVVLLVGDSMRGRYACSRHASANARASRRSVFTRRSRLADIGAKFGSPTTNSCPSPSRQRATHSLSVDAPTRIRALGRLPTNSAELFRSVRIRCSSTSPFRVMTHTLLSRLWTSMPMYSMAGPSLLRPFGRASGTSGVNLTTALGGGQPLHPLSARRAEKNLHS
jgi:hypothetical protein